MLKIHISVLLKNLSKANRENEFQLFFFPSYFVKWGQDRHIEVAKGLGMCDSHCPFSNYPSLHRHTHRYTQLFFPHEQAPRNMKTFMPSLSRATALGREHKKALASATMDYYSPWKAVMLSIIQNNLHAMETAVIKASIPWLASFTFTIEGPFLHEYKCVCLTTCRK